MKGSTALDKAKALVYGERQQSYSPPYQSFARTAKMWTGLLQDKLLPGEEVTAKEVALMMVSLKLSREVYKHKEDNLVDAAGYVECAAIVSRAEGEGRKE